MSKGKPTYQETIERALANGKNAREAARAAQKILNDISDADLIANISREPCRLHGRENRITVVPVVRTVADAALSEDERVTPQSSSSPTSLAINSGGFREAVVANRIAYFNSLQK